ncbi:MAG: SoxR reducing system RseC family protein [Candidatus Omnitrophica bacterium]|nr:SoxR reducing system RseC family protein [Candidatus Omnitrophota bacterium]
MRKTGVVTELKEGAVWVSLYPEANACRGCGASGLCGIRLDGKKLKAISEIKVRAGDRVEVEIKSEQSLAIAFFVYIVPVAVFILAAETAGFFGRSQVFQLVSGAAGFLITCIALYAADKNRGRSAAYLPKIKKIISDSYEEKE